MKSQIQLFVLEYGWQRNKESDLTVHNSTMAQLLVVFGGSFIPICGSRVYT